MFAQASLSYSVRRRVGIFGTMSFPGEVGMSRQCVCLMRGWVCPGAWVYLGVCLGKWVCPGMNMSRRGYVQGRWVCLGYWYILDGYVQGWACLGGGFPPPGPGTIGYGRKVGGRHPTVWSLVLFMPVKNKLFPFLLSNTFWIFFTFFRSRYPRLRLLYNKPGQGPGALVWDLNLPLLLCPHDSHHGSVRTNRVGDKEVNSLQNWVRLVHSQRDHGVRTACSAAGAGSESGAQNVRWVPCL